MKIGIGIEIIKIRKDMLWIQKQLLSTQKDIKFILEELIKIRNKK